MGSLSTCVLLSRLSEPFVFRHILLDCIQLLSDETSRNDLRNFIKFGRHVRKLTIIPQHPCDFVVATPILLEIVSHLQQWNVQELVLLLRDDQLDDVELGRIFRSLPVVTKWTICEGYCDPEDTYWGEFDGTPKDVEQGVYNRTIARMVDSHASQIRSLTYQCLIPLHPPTFARLRDEAPSLRSLSFLHSISIDCSALFREPIRWASADTLEELTFRRCEGVHSGYLAHNLAAGIFGCTLRRLEIVSCGEPGDDRTVPPPSNAQEFHLGTLVVDHSEAWELRGLVTLRIDHAVLTRVDWQEINELLDEDDRFPQLKTLAVEPLEKNEGDEGLVKRCLARRIELLRTGIAFASCSCHEE